MDATDRGTLHAVSTCSRVHAAGADLEGSSPFITEHMLDLMRKRMALNDYCQSSVLWFFDESGQPPLYCSASVLRTHYSVNENTHLLAGTER